MRIEVKELVTFIRTPTWITAGFAQSKAGPEGANFECMISHLLPTKQLFINSTDTEEQKNVFRKDPKKYLEYRKDIEGELNSRFKFVGLSFPFRKFAGLISTRSLRTALNRRKPSSFLSTK